MNDSLHAPTLRECLDQWRANTRLDQSAGSFAEAARIPLAIAKEAMLDTVVGRAFLDRPIRHCQVAPLPVGDDMDPKLVAYVDFMMRQVREQMQLGEARLQSQAAMIADMRNEIDRLKAGALHHTAGSGGAFYVSTSPMAVGLPCSICGFITADVVACVLPNCPKRSSTIRL